MADEEGKKGEESSGAASKEAAAALLRAATSRVKEGVSPAEAAKEEEEEEDFGQSYDGNEDNVAVYEKKSSAAAARQQPQPPSLLRRLLLTAAAYAALALVVYLLGYFEFSFVLFVLAPSAAVIVGRQRKEERRRKSDLHRLMSEMGEEEFLRATLRDSAPAWMSFPDVERAEWINTAAAALWPHVGNMTGRVLRRDVEPMAREVLEGYKVYGFKFEQIDLGRVPPRVTGIKVFTSEHGRAPDEVMADVDVEYGGDADIGISVMGVGASVRDLLVRGKIRIVLRPLIGDVPLVGGLQVYFLNQPELDFDLGGAGNLLEIPGLNGLLKGAIDDQIARHLVVPNRISVVLSDQVSAESIRMPRPAGILSVRILEARDLMQTDNRFKNIDPYVVVCRGALSKRTPVSSGNDPKWKEDARAILEFPVEEPQSERLRLRAMEEDTYTDDDFLGDADLDVLGALEQGSVDYWVRLQGVDSGEVHVKLRWLQASDDPADYQATDGKKHSRALLTLYLHSSSLTEEAAPGEPEVKVRFTLSYGSSSDGGEDGDEDEDKDKDVVTTSAESKGRDASFQEGFTLLVKRLEGVRLTAELLNAHCDRVVGAAEPVSLKEVAGMDDMYLKLEARDLEGNAAAAGDNHDDGDGDNNATSNVFVGSVTFSARLRYLSRSGSHSSSFNSTAGAIAGTVFGAASGLAGSSARAVGSVAGSSARAVGSATRGTLRTVGHAGQFLGATSAAAVRRVSPSRMFKGSSEKIDGGDDGNGNTKKGKEGLLETDLDVEDGASAKPKEQEDKGEKKKEEEEEEGKERKEEEGKGEVRKRFSDSFKFLK